MRLKCFYFLATLLILSSCNLPDDKNSAGGATLLPSPSDINVSTPAISSVPGAKTSSFSQFQEFEAKGEHIYALPSIGASKVLVLPIQFSDYTCNRLEGGCDESLKTLEDGFFGVRDEGEEIESLSSYYYQSSYGKLSISGDIGAWYTAPLSYAHYKRVPDSSDQLGLVETIVEGALAQYDASHDITPYDTNKDGYIDSVWLVYSAPVDFVGETMFWAFTSWIDSKKTYDGLKTCTYAWAGFDFLSEGGYTEHPDMHTFIHETGHMLALDDFYDYDSTSRNPSSPVGGLDMMDMNIGDHHAFSKYSLGWIQPKVLTQDATTVLKPFTDSGESIIIPARSYAGTSMAEYYILEYYTPTGLNKHDAEVSYPDRNKMFTEEGLLVYHVDQRVGELSSNYIWRGSYIEDVAAYLSDSSTSSNYAVVINSNSPSRSYNSNTSLKLVELISGTGTIDHSRYSENRDLFAVGSNLGVTTYKNLRWNDGTSLGFSLTVDSASKAGLTVSFDKD